jgi:hypothetical protein
MCFVEYLFSAILMGEILIGNYSTQQCFCAIVAKGLEVAA